MTEYLCALCSASLTQAEVEEHFRRHHPTQLPPDCPPLRLIHSGLLIPVRRGRPEERHHACAICGFRARFYATATIHVLIEHPAEARAHIPRGGTSLRRAYALLVEAGLIVPPGDWARKKERSGSGEGGNGRGSGEDEFERGVEKAVAALLSRHLGRTARLLSSRIARSAVGEREWRRKGALLSGRAAAILRRWREEVKVITDERGRRWLVSATSGGNGRPRAALFSRLD